MSDAIACRAESGSCEAAMRREDPEGNHLMKSSGIFPRAIASHIAVPALLACVGCGLFQGSKPEGEPASSSQGAASNAQPGKKKLTTEETLAEMSLNDGFTLLYELMGKESDVDKILILRNASEPTQAIVQEIAKTCAAAKEHLDLLAKQNRLLHLDHHELPRAEIDAREAIAWSTTKKLILGAEFELKLVLTQISSTEYAAFLALTLADRDKDKERKAWLQELGKSFQELHQKIVQRLMVKP
jgi:hypothetical protein